MIHGLRKLETALDAFLNGLPANCFYQFVTVVYQGKVYESFRIYSYNENISRFNLFSRTASTETHIQFTLNEKSFISSNSDEAIHMVNEITKESTRDDTVAPSICATDGPDGSVRLDLNGCSLTAIPETAS